MIKIENELISDMEIMLRMRYYLQNENYLSFREIEGKVLSPLSMSLATVELPLFIKMWV